MSIPSFLGPLVKLKAPAVTPEGTLLGGAQLLQLDMRHSLEDNWCWAAVAVSVCAFYSPGSTLSQCQVASSCLNLECCTDAKPCDVPFDLAAALAESLNLAEQPSQVALSFRDLAAQIDLGKPVCCHISWDDGRTGHFNALAGYDPTNQDVDVRDPLYESNTLPFEKFVNSYRHNGKWDGTYLTRRAPGV
jgi:hypothetical protein